VQKCQHEEEPILDFKQEIVRQYLFRGWVDAAISVHPQYKLYVYKQ